MKEITLTQGKVEIVDDFDYQLVSAYKWYAAKIGNCFYAITNITVNNKQKNLRMHRLIMNTQKGFDTDHIDHDGLNNQKSNLRICTRAENSMNQRKTKSYSKYKGVTWHKPTNKLMAQIKKNRNHIHIGLYSTEKEAAEAYNNKAIELFGKFSCLNLIED